ncbi:MAG TPA: DUF4032 domain-containing protein [Anaerolineae bacterium]|nr:DUF4032 domain-containing protein [Anaerolineae bacterium]
MSDIVPTMSDGAFRAARWRAFFQHIRAWFTGHKVSPLLRLDAVREKLDIRGQHYAGLQSIPVGQIVGSAGRYHDFNRAFLPEQEYVKQRWRRVYAAAHSPQGFPPIEVYQVGEAYFVRDGHHRVSVLKELGAPSIEAYVTVLESPVPLTADITDEELELKGEYASFLRQTGLRDVRPSAELQFSLRGQYPTLLEHIAVHRYYLGQEERREIPEDEAVGRWYDEVYLPLVRVIREVRILSVFPGRTEADLYLWIIEHRHYLSERSVQEVPIEEAAEEYVREFAPGSDRGKPAGRQEKEEEKDG